MNFLNTLKKKNLLIRVENIFLLILLFIVFLFDRISKISIINNFNKNTYYVNDYINFDLTWNIGIGFGLLSTHSILLYNLVSITIGLVIIILFFIAINSNISDKIVYTLIIGGALGNFYDRIVYKAVPDFIDLHYLNFHWFTFNVADIFITIGIMIYIIRSFFIKIKK